MWKVPAVGDRVLSIHPVLPAVCKTVRLPATTLMDGSQIQRWTVACGAGGLEGQTIAIDGLAATLVDALVRIQFADGAVVSRLLRGGEPSFVVRSHGSATPVLGYLSLGVEHILLGVDHLLFVLGLLLIVRDRWVLIKTISAFTVAHSITLGIATLGVASAPVAPLNAAIALSILFLGPEIVRVRRGETSLTIRYPWLVAFAFGLLHGFGFASGLRSIGLPGSEIALALLMFNVGVEIGQLLFVLLILSLAWSFRQLEIRWPRWAIALPGYAVGTLGAFWTLQRAWLVIGTP